MYNATISPSATSTTIHADTTNPSTIYPGAIHSPTLPSAAIYPATLHPAAICPAAISVVYPYTVNRPASYTYSATVIVYPGAIYSDIIIMLLLILLLFVLADFKAKRISIILSSSRKCFKFFKDIQLSATAGMQYS